MEREQLQTQPSIAAAAKGKWPYIHEDLVPDLAEAIRHAGYHVPCPFHGGKDGFRLFKDYMETGGGICTQCGGFRDGFRLLAYALACTVDEAEEAVKAWLLGELATPTLHRRPPPPPTAPPVDPAEALMYNQRLWTGTRVLTGSPVERYLLWRGIPLESHPRTLRYHPNLRYYDPKAKKLVGVFPGLLTAVQTPSGAVAALHRIFLTAEGRKAPVDKAKKLTGKSESLRGAAIRLFPCTEEVLGVGEGIETLLAVRSVTRLPVWSAISAPFLELLEVPETVRHVVIWGDKDLNGCGQRAAEVLAERMIRSGRTVEIQIPPFPIPKGQKGIDWLDVLVEYGVEGFPWRWRCLRPAA